ncbi:MAG: hypothetical protein LBM95_09985 [Lactobacillales bacterium]|jgi:hypothetical protein|nr:hypothetical protein [Lactobacillales bacterium]
MERGTELLKKLGTTVQSITEQVLIDNGVEKHEAARCAKKVCYKFKHTKNFNVLFKELNYSENKLS